MPFVFANLEKEIDDKGDKGNVETPNKKANKDGATASPAPAPSTVRKYVARHGGPLRALRRYIAGFANDDAADDSDALGNQPPCRSYRNLRLVEELQFDIASQLKKVGERSPCARPIFKAIPRSPRPSTKLMC